MRRNRIRRNTRFDWKAYIHKAVTDIHGFTLVELIVVLTIMAIMAAYAVPSFLGYIDSIKEKQTLNNAKKVYMAVQALVGDAENDLVKPEDRLTDARIMELSGVTWETAGAVAPYQITYQAGVSSPPTKGMYEIRTFQYQESGYCAEYVPDNGTWTVSVSSGT